MLQKYFKNKILIFFISCYVSNAYSQVPGLPNINPTAVESKEGGQPKVDVEMLGLDNLENETLKSANDEVVAKANQDPFQEKVGHLSDQNSKNPTREAATQAANIDKDIAKEDSNNIEVGQKRQAEELPDNKKESVADNTEGVFSKIKNFIEKSEKKDPNQPPIEKDKKKVINLKLVDDEKNKVDNKKDEIDKQEQMKMLAKKKKERLLNLKKMYLLKVEQDRQPSNFITPKKKELSWSDKFYVTMELAPPLVARNRTTDNSHIPILPTFKERVYSLFQTIRSNDISAFNNLYRKIAIPDIKNQRGETILTYALLLKRHPVINSILSKGADPDLPNSLGHTPLDIAIESMDLKSTKILIDNHADIDYSDRYNRTFLMLAARRGYLPIVRLLVEHGADVNKYDNFGRTALSIALRHKKEIIAKYLLKNGALTWIEKPMSESNQQFLLELKNRWNNSIKLPQ